MLAIHWAPVSKTKSILRNGITKSGEGLYCFPLTGIKQLDRWWVWYFNRYHAHRRKKYNGFIFRIEQTDLPAYFGHWVNNRREPQTDSLEELEKQFRETVLWRLGEEMTFRLGIRSHYNLDRAKTDALFYQLADEEMKRRPEALSEFMNNLQYMRFTFEDYEIMLSHSIPAKRIIKIIPADNTAGKVLRIKKREQHLPRKIKNIRPFDIGD
ncbi:hypothetical protein ACTHGU_20105 [Chitinophagaceae bacterium MMS25-I14]